MFNPLTPSEMVAAIGRAGRDAARTSGPLDEFERGQLKAAYSASRHLAVELSEFPPELDALCERVEGAAERAGVAVDLTSRDPATVGRAVAELLASTRGGDDWTDLRGELHRALRDLCNREVTLLAAGLERR